jgi:predicted HicB family RNase H-like nuclease
MATFLLGVAAGAAIIKYNSMDEAEKEELMNKIKSKAEEVKGEAEATISTLQTYFEDLKGKGMEAVKQYSGEAEKMVQDFMNQTKANPDAGKQA